MRYTVSIWSTWAVGPIAQYDYAEEGRARVIADRKFEERQSGTTVSIFDHVTGRVIYRRSI